MNDKQQYERDGYFVARSLFSKEEVGFFIDHYMQMNDENQKKNKPEYWKDPNKAYDPLYDYPRIMHPHRFDEASLRFMIDSRLDHYMTLLLGQSPYAVQTMLYFKPPGARGQALHQDNFYLKVQPGTCMAAWMALDRCDEQNGCLQVVPGSHTWDILCTTQADASESFTDVTVDLPEGVQPVPVIMEPGDVLFFNGQLVHGSFPNTTTDRFRRSLIGHYIVAEAEKVGKHYFPVLHMDGSLVEGLGESPDATTCGVWIDRDGQHVLEIVEKA